MKNPLVIISLLAFVSISGFLLLMRFSSNSPSQFPLSSNATANKGSETTVEGGTSANSSRYVEFSPEAFSSANNKRRVLFFYASWCPTCRPADANFNANLNKIPEDVVVIRVNYNDPETDSAEKDLAKQYEITYQHTFVQIDTDGNEVTKWNGGQIEELLENIK